MRSASNGRSSAAIRSPASRFNCVDMSVIISASCRNFWLQNAFRSFRDPARVFGNPPDLFSVLSRGKDLPQVERVGCLVEVFPGDAEAFVSVIADPAPEF